MLKSSKKHSKALVFFAVSKQITIVYSADRGRAEKKHTDQSVLPKGDNPNIHALYVKKVLQHAVKQWTVIFVKDGRTSNAHGLSQMIFTKI